MPLTRRDLLSTTLTAGAAVTAGLMLGSGSARATAVGFRWCSRCQSLWFSGGGDNGHCPVSHLWDHSHYQDGSLPYTLRKSTESGQGQVGWHWCRTCKAVYYSGQGELGWGVCPNDPSGLGVHTQGDLEFTPDQTAWVSFRMETADANNGSGLQAGWRFCVECNVLFFKDNGTSATHCPAGGEHDPNHSLDYRMRG